MWEKRRVHLNTGAEDIKQNATLIGMEFTYSCMSAWVLIVITFFFHLLDDSIKNASQVLGGLYS